MFNTQQSVAAAIIEKYKELALQPAPRDYWVLDIRDGKLTGPYNGLFTALTFVRDLNAMVARNTGEATCPFTAHDKTGVRVDPGI